MSLSIAIPAIRHESAFIAMLTDFELHDPPNAGFYSAAKRGFDAYVQTLLDEERGQNLRDGHVPCTHRWLMDAHGSVVGVTRLRHNIETSSLASEAGHIGYDVAPSFRGKGYGHRALQASLAEAQRLGLDRVLVVANEDNQPSRRTIERQGGELEAVVFSEHWQQTVCRYWIRVGG